MLQDVNEKQREEQEYRKALSKAAKKRGRKHISRLMNPNISSEMER